MQIESVDVESVSVEGHRPLDQSKVVALAESMKAIGLMTPISVRAVNDGERLELLAGNHRLSAAKALGWEKIDACMFVDVEGDRDARYLDDIDAQIWQIDENLMRSELTPAQEADCLKRRKELWERRETARSPRSFQGRGNKGFVREVQERTGKAKRTTQEAISRASRIENVAALTGTSLDKGVELDALAKLPPEEQKPLIERAKAGESVTARISRTIEYTATQNALQALGRAWADANDEARQRFIDETIAPYQVRAA